MWRHRLRSRLQRLLATPEAAASGLSGRKIEGRSLGQIAWLRPRRQDSNRQRASLITLLILIAIVGPFSGTEPRCLPPEPHQSDAPARPNGRLRRHQPGPSTGRRAPDRPGRELSRIVNGARYSLLIAFLSTALAVIIGVFFGHHRATTSAAGSTPIIARDHGRLPGVPAVGLRLALVGVVPYRGQPSASAATEPANRGHADLHHRVLQLAIYGSHHSRSDAVAARA